MTKQWCILLHCFNKYKALLQQNGIINLLGKKAPSQIMKNEKISVETAAIWTSLTIY